LGFSASWAFGLSGAGVKVLGCRAFGLLGLFGLSGVMQIAAKFKNKTNPTKQTLINKL
jgi:hypothetical protein